MKKIILILVIVLIAVEVHSQQIDNKINLYLGYSVGNCLGNEMKVEENFNYPALFSNYQDVSGYSFRALMNAGKHLSYGVRVDLIEARNWVFIGHSEFADSQLRLNSFSPEIRIHTGFNGHGIFNRLGFYGSLAPEIGILSLNLAEEPFEILGANASQYTFLENEEIFTGFSVSMGAEYVLAQWMGLFIDYSQHFNWTSSLVFQEGGFFRSQLQFGVLIRILKDKRYYYY